MHERLGSLWGAYGRHRVTAISAPFTLASFLASSLLLVHSSWGWVVLLLHPINLVLKEKLLVMNICIFKTSLLLLRWLSPLSKFLLGKLTVFQLVKKLSNFYRARMLFTLCTTADLSWACWIQSTPYFLKVHFDKVPSNKIRNCLRVIIGLVDHFW